MTRTTIKDWVPITGLLLATSLLGTGCASDDEVRPDEDGVIDDKADVSPGPDAAAAAAALSRARQAFAAGNDQVLVEAARDVLRAEANALRPRATEALQLLDAAYERNSTGNLSLSPNVPAAFGELRVHFRTYTRKDYVDGLNFHWAKLFTHSVWIEGPSSLSVVSIRLARHQTGQEDLVYLDSALGLGTPIPALDPVTATSQTKVIGFARVAIGHFPGPMDEHDPRWMQTRALYKLKIALTDGATLDTFFIVTNGHTTEIPEVLSPDTVEVIETRTPTIELGNLASTQRRPFEALGLQLYMLQDRDVPNAEADRPGEAMVWRKFVASPTANTSIPLSQPPFDGNPVLADDKFFKLLTVTNESRGFGRLVVSRDYALETPFRVEAP